MKAAPPVFFLVLIIVLVSAGCTDTAAPDEQSAPATPVVATITPDTRPDGITAFVDRAIARAQEKGKDAALREFNDPNGSFIQGDLYIFAYGTDGTTLAYPYRPDLLGVNRAEVTDPNGVRHIERMIDLAREGGGWVYYVTSNPADGGRQEIKISLVRPVDPAWFVGAGTYLPELPAVFNATGKDELVRRVDRAAAYAREHGAGVAVRDFNDRNGTFADGSRYIFAYGFNGTTLAMPFQPESLGTNRTDFVDTHGVRVAKWEMDVAQRGGGFVYVDYYNPDTGSPGMKLCYVTPVDDTWFVGSGIYARPQ